MMKSYSKKFHLAIKLALGAHGLFHVAEFVLNLAEGATASALLTLFSGGLMLSSAMCIQHRLIDVDLIDHHHVSPRNNS